MAEMTGADVADLEHGASELAAIGRQVGGMRRPLRSQLYSSPWRGAASERFRRDWDRVHSPALAEVEEFLVGAAAALQAHAQEQLGASSDPGGRSVGDRTNPLVCTELEVWPGNAHGWRTSELDGGVLDVDSGASGRWGFDESEMEASASGTADARAALMHGAIERERETGLGRAHLGADAMLGAEAGLRGEASVGLDGAKGSAGFDGFVGGRVGADAGLSSDYAEASGRVELKAGFGATGRVNGELSFDEVRLGGKFGLAIFVGGGVEGSVAVKPREIVNSIKGVFPW